MKASILLAIVLVATIASASPTAVITQEDAAAAAPANSLHQINLAHGHRRLLTQAGVSKSEIPTSLNDDDGRSSMMTLYSTFGGKQEEEKTHSKVCLLPGPCYKKTLVCPKRCGGRLPGGGNGGAIENHLSAAQCTFNCKKCVAHCRSAL